MKPQVQQYFGFKKMPFSATIEIEDYFKLTSMLDVEEGIKFTSEVGSTYTLMGEIGSGKSTILDYAINNLNKKEKLMMVKVVGGKWGMTEFISTILRAFSSPVTTNRISILMHELGVAVDASYSEGLKPILCVDESHLLNSDIFQQLHLLSQQGQKGLMPLVLVGQNDLLDKLRQPLARPLYSRIGDAYQVEALSSSEAIAYIDHHLKNIAGVSPSVIEDKAKIAIGQFSNNIMRSMNELAYRSLRIAMKNERTYVSWADVNVANKPLFR
jgi:general secretion pathway protein A